MKRIIIIGVAVSAASVAIAATDKQAQQDVMIVHEAPAVKCERHDGKIIMAAVGYCKDIGGRITELSPQGGVKPVVGEKKK